MKKLEKKDKVAQIANIKSVNCFLQTNLPNITLANKSSCMVCTVCLFNYVLLYIYSSLSLSLSLSLSVIVHLKCLNEKGMVTKSDIDIWQQQLLKVSPYHYVAN